MCIIVSQAIHFLDRALELSDSSQLSADVLHLRGGAYKDMDLLEEAEKVRIHFMIM